MDVAGKHLAELEKLLTAYASEMQAYIPRFGMQKDEDESDYDHLSRFREWSLSGSAAMSRNLQASRAQLKASDPAATAWVNANAGSGKTHVLVDRVIRLMLDGHGALAHHVPHLHQGGGRRNGEPPVRAPEQMDRARG